MPNIASVLKSEISRLARKESRSETGTLRRSVTSHRTDIAALKRRLQELEQTIRRLGKTSAKAQKTEAGVTESKLRFSAKGLAAQRKRLQLSAADVGLLLGTTGQTIYNWEAGKARPRASHMPAIAALRRLGKREADAVLVARRSK